MSPLPYLLGFLLPACGAAGEQGLPVPPPLDLAHIKARSRPNQALAGPAGLRPAPHIVAPAYALAPDRLFAVVRAVAAAQPRTFLAAEYEAPSQAHWVVRSALCNFPDLVAALVIAETGGGSTLVLYSRSVYGYSDFGANRGRLTAWLAAIDVAAREAARGAAEPSARN